MIDQYMVFSAKNCFIRFKENANNTECDKITTAFNQV